MKRSYLIIAAIAFAFSTYNCGGPKKLESANNAEEISVPLSGKDYQSNKEFFRAKSSGKSVDMATAKKIALNNAKGEIAGLINSKIKAVTDNYTNQRSTADASDFENKFENLTREVTNQSLNDVAIIGEKVFKNKDNSYEYWIAIEISKEAILNGIKGISNNQKVQIDYDKKKYEEIYKQEMEKMEEGK